MATLIESAAQADVSSWLYAGPGYGVLDDAMGTSRQRYQLQLETGMGAPPSWLVNVGGLLRSQTHFGAGTDFSLMLRTATYGYVNGGWGAALDLGPYQRWWGKGSSGAAASLMLGGPWGLTAGLVGQLGGDESRTFSATLGLDLARLTVYRTSGSSWWKNAYPAVDREQSQGLR